MLFLRFHDPVEKLIYIFLHFSGTIKEVITTEIMTCMEVIF